MVELTLLRTARDDQNAPKYSARLRQNRRCREISARAQSPSCGGPCLGSSASQSCIPRLVLGIGLFFIAYCVTAISAAYCMLSLWPWLVCLRLLRRMRMRRASIDLELYNLLASEPCLGQHTLDGKAQNPIRVARHHPLVRNCLKAAGVARVAVIRFLILFTPRHMHLLGINHHHEIAAIKVGTERWL